MQAEIQKKKKERRDESLKKSDVPRPVASQNESLTDTETILLEKESDAKRMAILQAYAPESHSGKIVEVTSREFLDGRPGPITNQALIDTSFDD